MQDAGAGQAGPLPGRGRAGPWSQAARSRPAAHEGECAAGAGSPRYRLRILAQRDLGSTEQASDSVRKRRRTRR
jgi:hypothetical protein